MDNIIPFSHDVRIEIQNELNNHFVILRGKILDWIVTIIKRLSKYYLNNNTTQILPKDRSLRKYIHGCKIYVNGSNIKLVFDFTNKNRIYDLESIMHLLKKYNYDCHFILRKEIKYCDFIWQTPRMALEIFI